MKRTVLMLTVIMMAPVLALAQSHWSVSPAVGFYKAELDEISNDLDQAVEIFGATIQKPNGGFHFGGKLHYEKSERWSWLAEVNVWKDKATGHVQDESRALDYVGQIRLVPIMIGSQYYFNLPENKARLYAGATGGIVLVNIKDQYNTVTQGVGTVSEVESRSGNDFVAKPFVGLEMGETSKISVWGELGYMLGKYSIEATAPEAGEIDKKDVSINGLHVTGGVKFRL